MRKEFRLLVETQDGLRRLCKFTDSANGSFKITFSPRPRSGEALNLWDLLRLSEDDFSAPTKSSGITIHSSNNPSGVTQINFSHESRYKPLFTQALDAQKPYIPLSYQILGNLSGERHAIDEPNLKREKILTKIDTQKDTLVFGMILAPKDQPFQHIEDHPSNLLQLPFEHFDLWVIWSFFNWPAKPATINLKVLGGTPQSPVPGMANWEVCNFHTSVVSHYADSFFEVHGESR